MKKISVKKLAAVTGGILLTVSAIAPVFALTADEVDAFSYDAQGVPQVNVLAGSGAAKSDLIWAGNIAAAVAANTPGNTRTTTCTASLVGGDGGAAQVSVTDLGAMLTFAGEGVLAYDGELLDSADLNSDSGEVEYVGENITDSEFTKLTGQTRYYDDRDGDETSMGYVEDFLTVDVDAYFDDDDQVDALVADAGPGDLIYTLDIGNCIPYLDDPSNEPDAEIILPFLGKLYSVREMDPDKVTLLEEEAGLKLYKGETIPGLLGVDGQEYTVEVGDVYSEEVAAGDYYAELYLKDSAGNIVDTVQDNTGEIDFDEKLATPITLIEARKAETGTTEAWVKIVVGSAQLDLEDGENFPDNDAWGVTIDGNSTDFCGITVTNNGDEPDIFVDPLMIGGIHSYPMDFADVIFNGLTAEKSSTVELENGMLSFKDESKKTHDLKLYEIDRSYTGNFVVDGKKWYYDIDADALSYCLGTSTDVDIDDLSTCDNTDQTYANGVIEAISLEGKTGVVFDYGLRITNKATVDDPYDVEFVEWMLATDSWTVRGGPVLTFEGWEATDANYLDLDSTSGYFNENDTDTSPDDDLQDKGEEYAVFSIDEDGAAGLGMIYFMVDTDSGRLIDVDDYDAADPPAIASPDEVQVDQSAASGPDFSLSEDEDTDITYGLTDYTTEITISGGAFSAIVPEARRQVEVLVGSQEAGSVVGEEITLNEGETRTAEAGCSFTLNEVLYNATVTGGGAAGGSCDVTQQTYQALPSENKVEVFLDTATVPGKVVVVGGAMVNQAAKALGVQLNAAGDVKLEIMGTSLVVAGYTADDTANAARQLVNLLEA